MKLSDLEALVKAMRERADHNGHKDPNVEFYESNCPEFAAALANGNAFVNFDIDSEVTRDTLRHYTVTSDGSAAKRGDYAIPLKAC